MDPLNKHHADNFNIKPHEGNDIAIRHNFVHQKLMALINYIKSALRSIAYAISPKSNPAYISHMRGEDIATVEPADCGNEVVNQEMLKFSDDVHKFWESNTPQEVVDFFLKSAIKNSRKIIDSFDWMHLIEDGVIPDITQEELDAFSNARDGAVRIDYTKKIGKYGSTDNAITFRDIKNFYNVFMKYMNYTIKNDPQTAVRVANLEKLFFGDVDIVKRFDYRASFSIDQKQVDELSDKSKLLDSDRDLLKSDDDFVMLLQSLKEYTPTHKDYASGDEHNTFYNLVGNILGDNEDHPMNYTDLKRLKRSADIVGDILSKRNNDELTQPEYYSHMLYEASRLGLVSTDLGQDLYRAVHRSGDKISLNEFEAIILRHGFSKKMSGLITAIESFPDVLSKALAPINLDPQLKNAIQVNVLNDYYYAGS